MPRRLTRYRFAVVLLFFTLLPGDYRCFSQTKEPSDSPLTDGTLPALRAIAGGALIDSHAFKFLTELSDDVGARVTGTPAATKALEWGLAKMKTIGLENVHLEKWQMSRGWTRISAEAELVAPIRRPLKIDSMGWVGSTPAGVVEAEVVPVNVFDLDGELKIESPKWAG